MEIKASILFALIVFSLVGSISLAFGQSSANNSVIFAPTTLSYVGNEGQSQLTRTLTFIGTANQSVTVALVATDLYDSNKGQTLSASNIEITPSTFSITGNQQQVVNVSLNISSAVNGTYQGTILVTTSIFNSTTSNMQISNTSIGISALIQPELTLLAPSATNSLTYAPTTLSFFGTNGQAQLKRTLTFVGITNQSLTVNLTPTDLYDNNTGNSISSNKIEISPSNFTIQGNSTTVNVSLETSQAIGGSYSGTILLTTSTINSSRNNLQVATTNIGVSATIQIGFSSLIQPQFYLVISIFIIEMVAFAAVSNDWPFKNYVVLIVTILALSIWAYMLFVYGFSQINGILTTIGTIFVAPFLIFITNYVRDQWSTENDKRKSVRDIENKGRANDIEMVRSVLGELETHFASFNPDPYPGRHEVNKKMETDSNKLAKMRQHQQLTQIQF